MLCREGPAAINCLYGDRNTTLKPFSGRRLGAVSEVRLKTCQESLYYHFTVWFSLLMIS